MVSDAFKINVYFDENGEEIEKLISDYLIDVTSKINDKNFYYFSI